MSAGAFCLHGDHFVMKRIAIALFTLALGACTQAPPPRTTPEPAPPPASPHRLTPLTAVSKTIVEPRIRVGLLSDQPSVTFARIPDGYFLLSEAGPHVIHRGF